MMRLIMIVVRIYLQAREKIVWDCIDSQRIVSQSCSVGHTLQFKTIFKQISQTCFQIKKSKPSLVKQSQPIIYLDFGMILTLIIINFFKTTSKSRNPDYLPSELTEQVRNNLSLPSIKSQEYESKIHELSNQVKLLRQRLMTMQQQKASSTEQEIATLQVENARLMRENKALRVRIHELQDQLRSRDREEGEVNGKAHDIASVKSQGAIRQHNARSLPVHYGALKSESEKQESRVTTTQLLRQLLAQCNEPSECGTMSQSDKLKDEFYEFKSSSDCFEPWFSQLSKELRIRLKRCLTRQKQLLWSSPLAQLGCICPYQQSPDHPPYSCKLLLVLTNLSPMPMSKICLSPLYAKDISLTRRNRPNSLKWQYGKELRPNEQLREEVLVEVNNIDFRCVQLQLEFEVAGGQKCRELLIVALSKGKLFRQVPYTSPPARTQRIERVFDYQKKVLSGVDKLGKLWTVVQGKQKIGGVRYYWKLVFLGRSFWLQAGKVEERMMIGVKFQNQRALAEKVLEEFAFLFEKI